MKLDKFLPLMIAALLVAACSGSLSDTDPVNPLVEIEPPERLLLKRCASSSVQMLGYRLLLQHLSEETEQSDLASSLLDAARDVRDEQCQLTEKALALVGYEPNVFFFGSSAVDVFNHRHSDLLNYLSAESGESLELSRSTLDTLIGARIDGYAASCAGASPEISSALYFGSSFFDFGPAHPTLTNASLATTLGSAEFDSFLDGTLEEHGGGSCGANGFSGGGSLLPNQDNQSAFKQCMTDFVETSSQACGPLSSDYQDPLDKAIAAHIQAWKEHKAAQDALNSEAATKLQGRLPDYEFMQQYTEDWQGQLATHDDVFIDETTSDSLGGVFGVGIGVSGGLPEGGIELGISAQIGESQRKLNPGEKIDEFMKAHEHLQKLNAAVESMGGELGDYEAAEAAARANLQEKEDALAEAVYDPYEDEEDVLHQGEDEMCPMVQIAGASFLLADPAASTPTEPTTPLTSADLLETCMCLVMDGDPSLDCSSEADERRECMMDPGGPAGGVDPKCMKYLRAGQELTGVDLDDSCPVALCPGDGFAFIGEGMQNPPWFPPNSQSCGCFTPSQRFDFYGGTGCCASAQCADGGVCKNTAEGGCYCETYEPCTNDIPDMPWSTSCDSPTPGVPGLGQLPRGPNGVPIVNGTPIVSPEDIALPDPAILPDHPPLEGPPLGGP